MEVFQSNYIPPINNLQGLGTRIVHCRKNIVKMFFYENRLWKHHSKRNETLHYTTYSPDNQDCIDHAD